VFPTISIKAGLHYNPYNIEGDPWTHKWMNMSEEVPFFDETDYSTWRIKMKGYLKSKGEGVWDTLLLDHFPQRINQTLQLKRKKNKNNAVAFKTIFNGLSGYVKESIG
jgi:hypothetical protein